MNLGRIIKFFTDAKVLKACYGLTTKGYLYERGWVNSVRMQRPINANNEPVPWVTISFLDFIRPRLKADMTIFEYGSGNSTLFYSRLVKSVTSVESDKSWYQNIEKEMPANVTLRYVPREAQDDYCNFASKSALRYDLIIVDGHSRFDCVKACLNSLSDNGVIVLDNSNRAEYKEIYEFLDIKGFRSLDFWGMAPGSLRTNCTTVFYQTKNCLLI
jgi:hypothetical protein